MSLTTPPKIRMLQRKLYLLAKEKPEQRFHSLYDKLPAKDQNALANRIIAELESEERWSRAFARSPKKLAAMAQEALAEHRRGETLPLDFCWSSHGALKKKRAELESRAGALAEDPLMAPEDPPIGGSVLTRIRRASALPGFRLRLELTDGSVIERDARRWMRGPAFRAIRKDEGEFAKVRVRGGTVAWPNGADLCPDVLINDGAPPWGRKLEGLATLAGGWEGSEGHAERGSLLGGSRSLPADGGSGTRRGWQQRDQRGSEGGASPEATSTTETDGFPVETGGGGRVGSGSDERLHPAGVDGEVFRIRIDATERSRFFARSAQL